MRSMIALLRLLPLLFVSLLLIPLQLVALLLRFERISGFLPVLFHRFCLLTLRLTLHPHHQASAQRPLLFLCNHISWMDIIVLSALFPVSFISKYEVRSWPFIGFLARLQRTYFIDRHQPYRSIKTAKDHPSFHARTPYLLFAEGTSSAGHHIYPFHSAFIGVLGQKFSDDSHQALHYQAVSLHYKCLSGLPVGFADAHQVGWYGDMSLLPHLWARLKGQPIDVHIRFGKSFAFTGVKDRKNLTSHLEKEVRFLRHSSS